MLSGAKARQQNWYWKSCVRPFFPPVSAACMHVQIQMLFAQVSQTHGFQHAQAGTIIRASIDNLSRKFSPKSRWCGSSVALMQENLGVALLYVLVDRWIGVNE